MCVLSDYQFDFLNLNNESYIVVNFSPAMTFKTTLHCKITDCSPLDDLKRVAVFRGVAARSRPPEPLNAAGRSCTSWWTMGSAFAAERRCDALFGVGLRRAMLLKAV